MTPSIKGHLPVSKISFLHTYQKKKNCFLHNMDFLEDLFTFSFMDFLEDLFLFR